MTLMSVVVKYTSDRCQNMLPDRAELIIGCRYEAFVNEQEQDLRLFLVGVFTLENIITMMGFAIVVFLLYILFKKDHDDESKLRQSGVIHGYCTHCGSINDRLATSCVKCGTLLKRALDHDPSQQLAEDQLLG